MGLIFYPSWVINLVGYAPDTRADGLYNAREELEYGYRAMLEREQERLQQMQLQQYQQQQYLLQQKLLDKQSMSNQVYGSGSGFNPKTIWGDGNR